MNETNKTLTYFAVAAAACLAAYISQPTSAEFDAADEVGKQLTKQFQIEDAKRMKITRFDEDAASLSSFEVAQVGRLWSIPSKGGYPADAETQMAKAVDGVREREILSVASNSAEDHEQFGVIDPESPKLTVGQTGVGARVTLLDQSDDPLVDLVIGEKVKDSDGLHYVRRADQDFVYVVQVNPDDFSTTFEDWIEDDLLKISPWDIEQVQINDYTAEMFPSGAGIGVDTDYKTQLTLRYNDSDSEWDAVSLMKATDAKRGVFEEFTLTEQEELDKDKLNDLKSALDDLTIVDVAKKPTGLSANLKAGEDFMKDNESLLSLIGRGFAPVGNAQGGADLLASNGELICTLKDGVEYVLRFGNPQILSLDEKKPDGSEESEQAVNRYLFVMARFNEDAIQKPELEDVPELPKNAESPAEDKRSDNASDAASAGDSKTAEGIAPENKPAPNDKDAKENPDQEAPTETSDDPEKEASDESDSPNTEALIAERKAIEQRNQQKLDEYADKIKEGKEKVAQLNARFGDWYYVVSNDVFTKIQLGRDEVIKQKEKPEEEQQAGQGAQPTADAGALGAPGAPIPGLPDFSGIEVEEVEVEDKPTADKPAAAEPAAKPPSNNAEEKVSKGGAPEEKAPAASAEK